MSSLTKNGFNFLTVPDLVDIDVISRCGFQPHDGEHSLVCSYYIYTFRNCLNNLYWFLLLIDIGIKEFEF